MVEQLDYFPVTAFQEQQSSGMKTGREEWITVKDVSDPSSALAFGPQIGSKFGDDMVVIKKDAERLNCDDCRVHIVYGILESGAGGGGAGGDNEEEGVESQYRLDVSPESVHVFNSINQIPAPDSLHGDVPFGDYTGRVIGGFEDDVKGADIFEGSIAYSETHSKTVAEFTTVYRDALIAMSDPPTVNDATFRDFAAGEVLFLGITADRRGDEDWIVTYNFRIKRDSTFEVFDIDDVSRNFDKLGWRLYTFEIGEISEGAGVKKGIMGVYEAVVYAESDFSTLDIGVTPFPEG